MRYSTEPKHEHHEQNMSSNIVKIFLILLQNLQQMQQKLFQKEKLKKTAEETGGLIGNKIPDKITKV